MYAWMLEAFVTGPLRRYMNARIGNGFINAAFSHVDARRVMVVCPRAVALFDRAQEAIFA
jgi:hypothetical protein